MSGKYRLLALDAGLGPGATYMDYPYQTPRKAIEALLAQYSPHQLALDLDIHNSHTYRARQGKITRGMVIKLRKLELIPPEKKRIQLKGDVSLELRERIRSQAEKQELTTGEFIEEMWEVYLYEVLCGRE